MHKTIEVSSGFLDDLSHFVVTVEIEDIVDEVEGVLVVVNFGVQAGEVEAIGQVFFVDLTKVLIATGGDELSRVLISLLSHILY